MRRMIAVLVVLVLSASRAHAQDTFPVTLGLGGGVISNHPDDYHAMFSVGIKPARLPIGLRLDGIWTPSGGRFNSDLLTAVSANAVITLRPWRVEPYLLVGATRTSEYSAPSLLGPQVYTFPARTELTGGLGLATKFGHGKLFGEFRQLQRSGTAITFGVSF